jgi:hypothetical protein
MRVYLVCEEMIERRITMNIKIPDTCLIITGVREEFDDKLQNIIDETNIKIKEAINVHDAKFKPTEIVVGVHPKKQSKNKFVQWLLIKLFGYELEYKTVMAKTVVINPEDCPDGFDGDFTFTIEEEYEI